MSATVKNWLEQIPQKDIRTRALKNLQVERTNDIAKSLEHAVFVAFLWHRTPEKYNYWAAVHHNIKYPADLMPVPKIK